jgi:hypothetical protein
MGLLSLPVTVGYANALLQPGPHVPSCSHAGPEPWLAVSVGTVAMRGGSEMLLSPAWYCSCTGALNVCLAGGRPRGTCSPPCSSIPYLLQGLQYTALGRSRWLPILTIPRRQGVVGALGPPWQKAARHRGQYPLTSAAPPLTVGNIFLASVNAGGSLGYWGFSNGAMILASSGGMLVVGDESPAKTRQGFISKDSHYCISLFLQ